MRSITWWLSVAALCAVSGCRLDLKGESGEQGGDDEPATGTADSQGTAVGGGRTRDAVGSDGSPLTCAAAALLPAVPELESYTEQIAGVVHVTDLKILQGEVSIAPGTIFLFDADSSLDIGRNNTRTTLKALGTPDRPIRFCSDQPALGDWEAVVLSNGLTSDSVLQHAYIENAGAKGTALAVDAAVSLIDVTVSGSKGTGVWASAFGADSARLSVLDAAGTAIVLASQVAVDKLPPGSVFEGNADNTAHVRFHAYSDGSVHIRNIGIPYVQEKSMNVANVTMDIDPGVDYRFVVDAFLDVGWNSNPVTFRVSGTAAEPVVFQGLTETKGSWGGVIIEPTVSTDSFLTNVQVLFGGTGAIPLGLHAKITVQDVLVADSATPPAITAQLTPESKNFTVTRCDGVALDSNMEALTGLPRGGSLTGNASDVIRIPRLSGSTALGMATIPNMGVPYFLVGDINIGAGSNVTVEPGVEFVFESGNPYAFVLGWNSSEVVFNAVGTAAQPIVFRGEKAEAGSWKGIFIEHAVSSNSVLDHIAVSNAGLSTYAPVTIQNSSFSDSPGFGILKSPAIMTDYAATNSFANNTQGDVGVAQ
jgi:hypothetical protein